MSTKNVLSRNKFRQEITERTEMITKRGISSHTSGQFLISCQGNIVLPKSIALSFSDVKQGVLSFTKIGKEKRLSNFVTVDGISRIFGTSITVRDLPAPPVNEK